MGMGKNNPSFTVIGIELVLANQEWDYEVMIYIFIKNHFSAQ